MRTVGRTAPTFPSAGRLAEAICLPAITAAGKALGLHRYNSAYATGKGQQMRERLGRGETVYLLGLGPSGHNSAAALVEVSRKGGIRPICSNEEERYTAVRHDGSFPENSLRDLLTSLRERDITPERILAVVGSWDYVKGISTCIRLAVEEAPAGFMLVREAASPRMNVWHFIRALKAQAQLKAVLGASRRVPVIGMRHHNNHAYLSYAASPFATRSTPTLITVIDGFGDDAATSFYVGNNGRVELIRANPNIFDSLGIVYALLSSCIGGWTVLSSEGRFMGAAAWGDCERLSNPFYKRLRQLLYLDSEGQVHVDRSLINYHRRGQDKPFAPALEEILGRPVSQRLIRDPDAAAGIDDATWPTLTRDQVDMAAALQLLFEDALVHIVDHLVRSTGSTQLVLSGGTALNCVANMRLLEVFDETYYSTALGQHGQRLHIWVPPNPSDTGTAMGAAYQFAMAHGAPLGPPLKHAFLCGTPATAADIRHAVASTGDTECISLGNLSNQSTLERVANAVAESICDNAILGIFQGRGETGPRALGHRTILANACNPHIAELLNAHVKYREPFRPLGPMTTLEQASTLFELSPGASDDDYNAYNYMVLTVTAKPESRQLIPGVIHRDGTSRIQIVRGDTDPLSYAILKALGRHLGLEIAVNTSLNVGSPIVHSPTQAVEALHRAHGMTGLLLVAGNGDAYLAWNDAVTNHRPSLLERFAALSPQHSTR